MSIRRPLWSATAVTFMVVTALAVAACGTSDLSAEEEEYFEEVRAAKALTTSKFDNFSEIFGQAWPLRSFLIDALLEAGVGTAFTGTLQVLEELTPPERFRADHERMVEAARESVRVDGEIAQAVKDDDLARFVLLNGELGQVNSSVAPGFSAAFCKNAFETEEDPATLCGPAGPVPGGEYGASVHDALRRFEPAFMTVGGVFGFPLTLRPDELAKVLATQAPIFGEHLHEVRAQVESLTPPEELRADHDRLVAYYDGFVDGVSKLTAAVEAGDVETAQRQLIGFQGQFCATRGSFSSSQFKELVGLHFRADPDACDGAPF